MRFVIVTGMSGAGKITALKIFEDNGYYCVDNLPIDLIENFADLLFSQTSEKNKVAIGVDIRSGNNLDRINEVLENLRIKDQNYEILFLDCNNSTLIKRFKETPLQVFLFAGAFADEHDARILGAVTEYEVMPRLTETAAPALRALLLEFFPGFVHALWLLFPWMNQLFAAGSAKKYIVM